MESYLTIDELVAMSKLSRATLWRLKRDGKIPFYQPGGKGAKVLFPVDALEITERNNQSTTNDAVGNNKPAEPKSGCKPNWMNKPSRLN